MTRLLSAALTSGLLALLPSAAPAADASVIGDWLVKDGYANIRIDNCGGKMWGIVVWEKVPGLDTENPDPAKRTRPTLGMPVLMGLSPAKEPGKWSGEIYNSNNGKMYSANISLADENTLDLEGCLVWPLCQTQKWTRVKTLPPNAAPLPPLPATTKQVPPVKKGAAAPPPPSEVCMRVTAETAPTGAGTAKK
jgi:uncharacterized protein (DUF2147 family)